MAKRFLLRRWVMCAQLTNGTSDYTKWYTKVIGTIVNVRQVEAVVINLNLHNVIPKHFIQTYSDGSELQITGFDNCKVAFTPAVHRWQK